MNIDLLYKTALYQRGLHIMGFFDEFSKGVGKKTGEGLGQGVNNSFGFAWSMFTQFIGWLISFKEAGERESFFKKNAVRLTVVTLIISLVTFGKCSISPPPSPPPSASASDVGQTSSNTIEVMVALSYGSSPVMPEDERFAMTPANETIKYFELKDTRYIRYQQTTDGSPFMLKVPTDASYCVLVPKKMEVRLDSTVPPRQAVNMDSKVWFAIEGKELSITDKLFSKSQGNGIYVVHKHWEFLRRHWNSVQKENYVVVAEALDRSPGGLVCF